MKSYAGLDISQQATQICVISDDGDILFEGKCATEPKTIAKTLKKHAPGLKRAVLETGSMSQFNSVTQTILTFGKKPLAARTAVLDRHRFSSELKQPNPIAITHRRRS